MKVTYHHDGGHGWYAVKRSIITSKGILSSVSPYSFQKGQTVYLEEDCDFSKLLNVLTEEEKAAIIMKDSYQDRSPVRGYDRFNQGN